jgi:ribosomal protein bL25 (Ctc-form)
MKLKISQRKHIELPPRKITLTAKGEVAGPNQIALRKKQNRDKGLPLTTPGMGQKSEITQIRERGDVPAVIYGKGLESKKIYITGADSEDGKGFHAVLREMKKDGKYLATTIFELHDGMSVCKAIIKEISYAKVGYDVLHIDFLRLDGDKSVTLNVPVEILGTADCKGIKAGGFPRLLMRSIRVSCAPSLIPRSIAVDITDLDMPVSKAPDAVLTGPRPITTKRISDIAFSEGMTVLAKKDALVVMIAKK